METSKYLKGRRLRVFAGPNGSGKSTIFYRIKAKYSIGFYINPDLLDKEMDEKGFVDLSDYGLNSDLDERFNNLIKTHPIAIKAIKDGLPINLTSEKGIISQKEIRINSYNSSFLSSFLGNELISSGKKFSLETVMSHHSKIDFLDLAKNNGYKNYLYYMSTESADINVDRVTLRVKDKGHYVEEEKIRSRYVRSMDLLYDATTRCYRSFIFDNSGKSAKLICEIDHEKNINLFKKRIPRWIYNHLILKAQDSHTIIYKEY